MLLFSVPMFPFSDQYFKPDPQADVLHYWVSVRSNCWALAECCNFNEISCSRWIGQGSFLEVQEVPDNCWKSVGEVSCFLLKNIRISFWSPSNVLQEPWGVCAVFATLLGGVEWRRPLHVPPPPLATSPAMNFRLHPWDCLRRSNVASRLTSRETENFRMK